MKLREKLRIKSWKYYKSICFNIKEEQILKVIRCRDSKGWHFAAKMGRTKWVKYKAMFAIDRYRDLHFHFPLDAFTPVSHFRKPTTFVSTSRAECRWAETRVGNFSSLEGCPFDEKQAGERKKKERRSSSSFCKTNTPALGERERGSAVRTCSKREDNDHGENAHYILLINLTMRARSWKEPTNESRLRETRRTYEPSQGHG